MIAYSLSTLLDDLYRLLVWTGKLKYEVTRANSQSPETFKRPRAQHKKRAGSVKQEKDDHPRIKIEATDSPVEAQEIEVVEWTGDAQSSALTKKSEFQIIADVFGISANLRTSSGRDLCSNGCPRPSPGEQRNLPICQGI